MDTNVAVAVALPAGVAAPTNGHSHAPTHALPPTRIPSHPLTIELLNLKEVKGVKEVRRGSLRAFVTVRVNAILTIRDIPLICDDRGRWHTAPVSRAVQNSDGTTRRSHDGRIIYVPIIEWASEQLAQQFSAAVVAAVGRRNPRFLTR